MARMIVPEHVGKCVVGRGPTGKYTVYNDQSGKNWICVPCNSKREAERICERLNTGDHNGSIPVPEPGRWK